MSRKTDLYVRARRALRTGEAAQWEAAECMAELYELGDTQREIAAQVGCSYRTVSRYLAVWENSGSDGPKQRPSFAEAMAEVRTDAGKPRAVPQTPEKKAELVAKLLKDKAVADAPAVRKVQERHAERRVRAEAAAFNREHGVSTRTQTEREGRRLSVVQNDHAWVKWLADINAAIRSVSEATSEVERTGLPRSGSGEVIKRARALGRAVERFEDAATEAGIGRAAS